MTDLEITKLCAEAMGLRVRGAVADGPNIWCHGLVDSYNPLHDDAQAMALVKKFGISIDCPDFSTSMYHCYIDSVNGGTYREDLNRAICECVAKMWLQHKKDGTTCEDEGCEHFGTPHSHV